jgi:hypothetical protein
MMHIVQILFLTRSLVLEVHPRKDVLAGLLLGATFALAWTSCVGASACVVYSIVYCFKIKPWLDFEAKKLCRISVLQLYISNPTPAPMPRDTKNKIALQK